MAEKVTSRSTTDQFVKPDNNEIFFIAFTDIVGKLDEPRELRRGVLKFDVDIREWRG